MLEPTEQQPPSERPSEEAAGAAPSSFMGRLFSGRPGPRDETGTASPVTSQVRPAEPASAPQDDPMSPSPEVGPAAPGSDVASASGGPSAADVREPVAVEPPIPRSVKSSGVPSELGERVQTGFQDLSRLLGAIKETLQGRDGQVQQTLQALPGFLQQVPRIHRAEIECLAQISKQLEHMGSGTKDVIARLDGLPDLLRSLALGQAEQSKFLDNLQANLAETLQTQSTAIREGLETSRKGAEAQLKMVRSIAATQEDIFSTFQNTQNRALNVFHRAQQQSIAQNRETTKVTSRQIEMLVDRVHSAQSRVFWLSIGFAALAAAGLLAVLFFGG